MSTTKNKTKIEKFFSYLSTFVMMIGAIVLTLFIVNQLLAPVVKSLKGKGGASGDRRAELPIYDDYADNEAFWKDHRKSWSKRFEPYFHWKRDDFESPYTNVKDGMRKTAGAVYGNNRKKIFMFGGSTMWGTGSKDEHTIASFLQADLGEKFAVYNYGETGYVSGQELNYLLYLLANGKIPDVVIFYDGVNDGYAGTYSPAIPRDPQNVRDHYNQKAPGTARFLFEKSNYGKLVKLLSRQSGTSTWEDQIKDGIEENSKGVVKMYEAHIKQVKALAKAYGFKAFFFWQPNITSETKLFQPYEKAFFKDFTDTFIHSQKSVYSTAKSAFSGREKEHIFFIGDIFNKTEKGLYIDWCHIGPDGNRIVADTMFQKIKNSL